MSGTFHKEKVRCWNLEVEGLTLELDNMRRELGGEERNEE